MTQKTMLLTGGAGFIGSALAPIAVAQGYRVTVLDKLTYAGHRQNLAGVDAELVVGDITDTGLLAKLFAEKDFTRVVHAAAESHVDNSILGSGPFVRTNIGGTHALLEAALTAWKGDTERRFLQVSTDEVYGALGETGEFTTETPLAPNSPYAASKASADLLVRAWVQTYGFPAIITRCCNNYGPRQHPEKLIPRMISNALAGEKLPVYGDGQQTREWIHADDHARGVLLALERGRPGHVYHLGSGEERRNLTLVHMLCEGLEKRKPGRDYKALIAHVTDRLGHDFRYALDISSARAIGFAPQIGFADGINQTIDWYLANGAWTDTMRAWKGA